MVRFVVVVLNGLGYGLDYHAPGHPGNGRFTHLDTGARTGHSSHTRSAGDAHSGACVRVQRDRGANLSAVGGVGVVASILDDGAGHLAAIVRGLAAVNIESNGPANGQLNR